MKILITGATGSVGTGVLEALPQQHDIRLSDIASPKGAASQPFFTADVREPHALDEAAQGVDVIIHTPAYHGIHMGTFTEKEFYDLNVTGTFEMFQTAVRNNVRRVVWLSSMSFFGDDFYAYTKKLGEQVCEFYHRKHGIEVLMLRPADFTPFRSIKHYGERLLHGGVDRRDVIQAVVKATTCEQRFGAYHIVRDDRFTEADVIAYAQGNRVDMWEKLYPGARGIIEKYGFNLPETIHPAELSREKQELGYAPSYNFGTFLDEFTRDNAIIETKQD
ncbi:NAD(P)-dependent oxidoreductase [Paenibacillus sp. OV219]|uniref:NAD-dependent epimerase/dehydratase family protein n=1 Tax=Paenibacillus sp. OV219 TaxID=1884377 RepID=UPI0008BB18AC|nr:NAD(P)-dependent oxidoreductase [Paenibacillus sp. OV219]SEO97038.1 Nucleoside-diphosphate-sugar epimerase [Paenibacillus sp. OV219]